MRVSNLIYRREFKPMEQTDIRCEIQDALAILDAEEVPEAYHYLSDLVAEDEPVREDPYDIACRLLQCDRPAPLPKALRSLIEMLFGAAFKAGNAEAMNDIGAQYYDGARGFEQDFTKSVTCYKLAAAKGSRQAQENLGYCYYYGRNMPVDYESAFHYFALGAFDGHLVSLYKIGDMYLNGYYVEKNPIEAFHISRCLETMTDEAAPRVAGPVFLRVGNALLNGDGADEDPKGALICFQKAEAFLYDMVASGDAMYKKSLQAAVDGQAKARKKLSEGIPDAEWTFD